MEATMYEDGSYSNYSRESLNQMKRRLTLDLNNRPSKKQRPGGNFNPLLTSPDLNQLKLASPELERLIIQQGSTILGNASTTPSQFFFPTKTATVEEEEFAKGFEDTLEQLHHQDAIATSSSGNVVVTSVAPPVSSAPLQYTQLDVPLHHAHHHHHPHQQVPVTSASVLSLEHQHHVSAAHLGLLPPAHIKEEPQTVPSVSGSPPLSPINMECQERIKLERKRLRNRIAASKCRRRKLERIGRLEDKVRGLKGENVELQAVVNKLKDQVCSLKQEVMEHVNSGCQIPFVTHQ
ncbi:transcription factor AP-1-like [Homarus americanus]|uniref:Transcription factor AP-1-like n=1 Tax=Homarus americanus TaxID=6706 RepID=A0A8J5JHX4_HOMAM|nr:transcription factor AP-1-like [Homarus americanus]KAG7157501.1 Transcription factor AP-1-like [Homarus americanus]